MLSSSGLLILFTVHMTKKGFDLLVGLVLEAATGAEDVDNRKRTLDMPEARPGLSKKRLF